MEPNEERQGNDKKAERPAKRRERRRQRLLEETAEEREARLGKRREAWKKRLLKRKVSKGLSSQRYAVKIPSVATKGEQLQIKHSLFSLKSL